MQSVILRPDSHLDLALQPMEGKQEAQTSLEMLQKTYRTLQIFTTSPVKWGHCRTNNGIWASASAVAKAAAKPRYCDALWHIRRNAKAAAEHTASHAIMRKAPSRQTLTATQIKPSPTPREQASAGVRAARPLEQRRGRRRRQPRCHRRCCCGAAAAAAGLRGRQATLAYPAAGRAVGRRTRRRPATTGGRALRRRAKTRAMRRATRRRPWCFWCRWRPRAAAAQAAPTCAAAAAAPGRRRCCLQRCCGGSAAETATRCRRRRLPDARQRPASRGAASWAPAGLGPWPPKHPAPASAPARALL